MTATAAKRAKNFEPYDAVAAPPPHLDPIHNKDLKLAEQERHSYQVRVEAGRSFESLLDVGSFSNVVGRLTVGDIIEVVKPGKWWAELLVARIDTVRRMAWVKVKTAPISLDVDVIGDAKNLRIEENGGKYRVLRGNTALQSGFENEAEALAWAYSGKGH